MTKFVAIAYREIDGYVDPRSITVVGIFDAEHDAYVGAEKYVKEHTFINECDVLEVEQ